MRQRPSFSLGISFFSTNRILKMICDVNVVILDRHVQDSLCRLSSSFEDLKG